MNKVISLLIISGSLFLMASKCERSENYSSKVPVTDYYDSCVSETIIDFGKLITLGDPNDRFMISLPYSWDIRESYSDSLYGIFGSNFLSIPRSVSERMSLGITGYTSDIDLKPYYLNELNSLVQDEYTEVIETGSTQINKEKAYWIKFNNAYKDQTIYQLVLYIKKPNSSEVYISQATAYSAEKQNNILCNLKLLMSSVEWSN